MSLADGGDTLDGPKGVTEEYLKGWERIFGKKPPPNPAEEAEIAADLESLDWSDTFGPSGSLHE